MSTLLEYSKMMVCIADSLIKPYCAVMFSKWDIFTYVKNWDGLNLRDIMGLYLEGFDTFYDTSIPPQDAIKGDMIFVKEMQH